MLILARLVFTVWLPALELLPAQQQLPYTYALTEPDQELDGFSGGYAGIHRISARLRGVRGADSTLYWVSADGRQLTAYKCGKQLWQADVAELFAHVIPKARINRIVFSSGVVFVFTAKGGHVELVRTTGKVAATGVDAE